MSGAGAAYRDRTFLLEGCELSYPTQFRDGSSTMGIFSVNAARADRLIEEMQRFQPEIVAATRQALEKSVPDLDFRRLHKESFATAPSIRTLVD